MLLSTGLSRHEAHGSKPLAVTIKKSMELSGLGLTKTYELINRGILETVWVDNRRLVIFSSLERLMLSAPAAQEAPRRRGRPRKVRP